MKRIGLLGGMSWESSAEYYRFINEEVRDRCGGLSSADCLLRSVDFTDIEPLQRAGRWEEAGARLAAEARALEVAGAQLLVLCTNTMHKVADAITEAVDVPFVHIADATADAVRAQRLHTVGLLATAYTMEEDFYVSDDGGSPPYRLYVDATRTICLPRPRPSASARWACGAASRPSTEVS